MKQTCNVLESGATWSCLILSASEACGSAAVVTSQNAQGIVIFSSVQINVLCHVRDVTVQWDAVVWTVGENACGWPFVTSVNPVLQQAT